MRTASMVLGIVGGAIALILAIVLFIGSSFVASVPFSDYSNWNFSDSSDSDWNYSDNSDSSDWNWNDDYDSDELNSLLDKLDDYDSDYVESQVSDALPGFFQSFMGTFLLVPAICAAIAGVLGLVGGIIVKKSNVAAGVLMIISAVLSLISFFNIISMALFIVGGVFALMRDRSKQPEYVPPYPMPPNYVYPQPPYPPQAYPQQPVQQPAPPSDNPPQNPQP